MVEHVTTEKESRAPAEIQNQATRVPVSHSTFIPSSLPLETADNLNFKMDIANTSIMTNTVDTVDQGENTAPATDGSFNKNNEMTASFEREEQQSEEQPTTISTEPTKIEATTTSTTGQDSATMILQDVPNNTPTVQTPVVSAPTRPVAVGDRVRIIKGQHKGKTAVISRPRKDKMWYVKLDDGRVPYVHKASVVALNGCDGSGFDRPGKFKIKSKIHCCCPLSGMRDERIKLPSTP